MTNVTRNIFVLAACLIAGTVSAADERVLFDNSDYAVTTADGNRYCEQPMTVTVESGNPDLFESEREMQRIVDGAQATLAYECPQVRALTVRGRLSGIPDPVFRGIAEKASDWRLDTRQSFESRHSGEDWNDDSGEEAPLTDFNVANLKAGMSVDEAKATIQEAFGVDSSYDKEKGVLDMQAGGCPESYNWASLSPLPSPGWKCLRAWFTDQRVERLYLVELIQVVEGDQANAIEGFLTDQFGEPAHRSSRDEQQEWWQEAPPQYTLTWGEVVSPTPVSEDGQQRERYTLEAHITPVEDLTILSVTLYEPGVRPTGTVRSDQPALDLNL